jgi:hypothetical protein
MTPTEGPFDCSPDSILDADEVIREILDTFDEKEFSSVERLTVVASLTAYIFLTEFRTEMTRAEFISHVRAILREAISLMSSVGVHRFRGRWEDHDKPR